MNAFQLSVAWKIFYHILIAVCLVFPEIFLRSTAAEEVPKQKTSEEVAELRKKWGSHHHIVRDLKHIEEDVSKVMHLQQTGDISANEAVFYFLKMHDFDDNRLLDGHEIFAAIRHSISHGSEELIPPMNDDDISSIVDAFFEYDDDNDGYISYLELRKNTAEEAE